MISCNNCGYGHKTVEELRKCRPWSEVQAGLICYCGARFDQHVGGKCVETHCNKFEVNYSKLIDNSN